MPIIDQILTYKPMKEAVRNANSMEREFERQKSNQTIITIESQQLKANAQEILRVTKNVYSNPRMQ